MDMGMDTDMAPTNKKINNIEISKMTIGNKVLFLNVMDTLSAFYL
jgi:hypothetical protein